MLAALHFPPVSHLVEWPDMFLKGNEWFAFNKLALLCLLSVALTMVLFWIAGRKQEMVPSGVIQNGIEATVDSVIRDNIVMQTMGHEGMKYLPFLTTLFFFIFFNNVWGIIPGIQMPVNARMAMPMLLTLIVWLTFHFVGIRSQGFFHYFKGIVAPPGVPLALLPLVGLIEFVSIMFIRPFSLAVRLFANILAGHLLLVTFAVLSAALFTKSFVIAVMPLTFVTLTALTAFEAFVAFLQAFIFTILTAVYIGGAMHPEH